MESSKQKLYRSNSNADDPTRFASQIHKRISSIFPFQFSEYSKFLYVKDLTPEDPDFSHDSEEPLHYIRYPVRRDQKAIKEEDFRYNLSAKGRKHFSHIEVPLSMYKPNTAEKSRIFGLNRVTNLKYVRSLTVTLHKEGQSDADILWLCNNVIKFLTNLRELRILPKKEKVFTGVLMRDEITESGFKHLLCCITTHLKRLESLHLVLNERRRVQEFSPQFLRFVTRHPTTCLINLKHYNLDLQGNWKIFQLDSEKEKPLDFSRLIAFNKAKFLRNIKELELGASWWDIQRFSTRSRKLALNIALRKEGLPAITSVMPCLFEHAKSLESFHLHFNMEMEEPAAIFFDAMVKGISMRMDTLQKLRFDLNNKMSFLSLPFSELNFDFHGANFAERNTIQKLDIYFHRYYNFKEVSNEFEDEGGRESEEEEEEEEVEEDSDRVSYEPFTTKIIPQLTNLTSLKVSFETEKTLSDWFAEMFMQKITTKLTKLETLSLSFSRNEEITHDIIGKMRDYFSDRDKSLPNLKKIQIDFFDCQNDPYDNYDPDFEPNPITKEDVKELQDALCKGRPDAKCVVNLNGDDSFKAFAEGSDGKEDWDEPLLEYDDSDDSDENLSDLPKEDEEEAKEDWINFIQSIKFGP